VEQAAQGDVAEAPGDEQGVLADEFLDRKEGAVRSADADFVADLEVVHDARDRADLAHGQFEIVGFADGRGRDREGRLAHAVDREHDELAGLVHERAAGIVFEFEERDQLGKLFFDLERGRTRQVGGEFFNLHACWPPIAY